MRLNKWLRLRRGKAKADLSLHDDAHGLQEGHGQSTFKLSPMSNMLIWDLQLGRKRAPMG